MGFTYTDRNKKTILHSWGRFRATLFEAVVVGDLVSFFDTDNSKTVEHADQSDSQAAHAVAQEDGAAGDTIWLALASEIKAPATVGTGGVVTQQDFAAAADFFGAPLYLGEDGKPSSSAGGTFSQLVGYLLARDRIMLQPNTALTGVSGSFTTLSASDIFSVTDATEATSTTAASMKTAGGLAVVKDARFGAAINFKGMIPIADGGNSSAIPVAFSGYCPLVTAGAETRTLADPVAVGQVIVLSLKTDLGDAVVTVASPINQTGNNTLTFADVGDSWMGIAVEDGGDKEWREFQNDGVALSTV